MRMGSEFSTACWMRLTATVIPSIWSGSVRSSMAGLKKAFAAVGSMMPRAISSAAMTRGQPICCARVFTLLAAASVVRIVHCCGPAWAETIARLLVAVVIVHDDAAEIGDGVHQVLEAVVPVGRDLEDEHYALVRESEL